MTDNDETEKMIALGRWADSLMRELGIEAAAFDLEQVLALASVAAHEVMRPAAPVTTFLVGYRAGLAAGQAGEDGAAAALQTATEQATALAARWREGGL